MSVMKLNQSPTNLKKKIIIIVMFLHTVWHLTHNMDKLSDDKVMCPCILSLRIQCHINKSGIY